MTTRHRLNYGGDRQANRALHLIAVCRLRYCERTRADVNRRTAEGKTQREIMRCLKRYIAREAFNSLRADLADTAQPRPMVSTAIMCGNPIRHLEKHRIMMTRSGGGSSSRASGSTEPALDIYRNVPAWLRAHRRPYGGALVNG
jgi:hypothetical protein